MPRIMPQPWIVLDGAALPRNGGRGTATNVAIDELVLTWGRLAEDESVAAATATARIWVPLGDLNFTRTLVGRPMLLQWDHQSTTFQFFTGRVSSYRIAVGPHPGVPAELSRGFIVTLTGSDKIADLVNIEFGPNTLSHNDNMLIRANLIKDNANTGGVSLEGVYFEPQTTEWPCGIYDTQGTNLRQWMDAFYMALGNWWTYCHDQNTIRGVRRWVDPQTRYWYAYTDADARHRAVVTYRPDNNVYDGITYESSFMPGRECYFDNGSAELDSTTSSAINTIAADYKTPSDADAILIVDGSDGGRRRTMRYTSWLSAPNIIEQVGNDLYSMYSGNMHPPKLPPITWNTGINGGFLSLENAKCMTRAYENPGEIVIGGSALTAGLNLNNQIQACGGRITWRQDHWEITINPKWCGDYSKHTPITWANSPSVPFDGPTVYLDPGLTASDMYDVPDRVVYVGED
ncbi:hypothetical protein [Nocardia sp. N2S4-5]|uniref:hypothetical protein n=1 Tax=Nocardia sp. N2S4-5 TaxID=3351565 RepID=UPI0037D8BED5